MGLPSSPANRHPPTSSKAPSSNIPTCTQGPLTYKSCLVLGAVTRLCKPHLPWGPERKVLNDKGIQLEELASLGELIRIEVDMIIHPLGGTSCHVWQTLKSRRGPRFADVDYTLHTTQIWGAISTKMYMPQLFGMFPLSRMGCFISNAHTDLLQVSPLYQLWHTCCNVLGLDCFVD